MERSVFDRMNEIEAQHWWFTARRRIIASLIGPLLRGKGDVRILEAGCGSGGNLSMLSRFGRVDAFEFDKVALAAAREKSGLDIHFGALPEAVPFVDNKYDLIGLFDVLEHIEADQASLVTLAGRLSEGGKILVTVPAFPSLWSKHDEQHHHFRRYTRASMTDVAQEAGLKVSYSSYFNTLLFPLAVGSRALKKIVGRQTPDDVLPPKWLNTVFAQIFGFERHLLQRCRLPFGLSLVATLEKA